MPHCCPQKQQWVFTNFSAGWMDSSCHPPGGTYCKCGPNCSFSASADAGGLAICLLLHCQLRERDQLSFAGGTQILPVPAGRGVIKSDLRQNTFEVIGMHARCVTLAAACANCSFTLGSNTLVKLDTKLRRTLKDVKELPKRKVK